MDVADHDLEVVQCTGRQLRQSLADGDRAGRTWRSQLHKANVITHRVVVVEDEAGLVDVEGLGAIDVANRYADKFEFEIHDFDVIGRLGQFRAPLSRPTDGAMEAWPH